MTKKSERNEPVSARAATLTPMNDQVLLRRFESAEKTEGGLVIPEIAREREQRAHVVSVGPGDVVVVDQWDGIEVTLDGVKHVMLPEGKILGVITTGKS